MLWCVYITICNQVVRAGTTLSDDDDDDDDDDDYYYLFVGHIS